ncbi:MAG: hypothetical protein IKP77_02050 [Acholeplasmatales bacterium]|nr:hypothetical protein [Acholeplasmatales bacterium]
MKGMISLETNFVKKHFKHILLVTVYTILFMVIYVIWFESLWHLWFVDVIAALLILSGGIVIGYFYLKGIVKEENKDNNQSESKPLEDNKEEVVEEKSDGE